MKKAIVFLGLSVLLFSNSALAQNLPSYLPTNGLVGWWPFNGNANDESGNGNHGVVNGAVLASDRNGVSNATYYFNGINNYIEISNSSSLNFFDFSISLWFRIQSNDGYNPNQTPLDPYQSLISKWWQDIVCNSNSAAYLVVYDNDNESILGFSQNNTQYTDAITSSPQSIGMNQWNQIIFTQSGIAGQQLFINGNEVASNNTGANYCYTTNNLYFGCDNYFGTLWRFLNGYLDDIAIYNRALTQEEITALYTGTPVNGGGSTSNVNAVPPGIPYQAVVRNANGQVAGNAAVTTRFTLHQTTADGAVEYQETHALTTNAQGLMATVLGQGTSVQNTFADINWANTTKFLQVEVDLGNGYVDLGTQQLMSVPFAQRAAAAGTIENGTLPIFADNAAALAGGLSVGKLYRTSTGDLKIVY